MTEKRFTTDNGSNEDVTLVDNVTGKEYESNFEDIVDLMNDLDRELMITRSRNTRLVLMLKDVVLFFEQHSEKFIKIAKYIRKQGNLEFNSERIWND